jgi:hypothetical protein
MIPSKSSAKSDQDFGNLTKNLRSLSNLVGIILAYLFSNRIGHCHIVNFQPQRS